MSNNLQAVSEREKGATDFVNLFITFIMANKFPKSLKTTALAPQLELGITVDWRCQLFQILELCNNLVFEAKHAW